MTEKTAWRFAGDLPPTALDKNAAITKPAKVIRAKLIRDDENPSTVLVTTGGSIIIFSNVKVRGAALLRRAS